jgi:hypothetical protein
MKKSDSAKSKSTPAAARTRRASTAATPRTRSPRASRGSSAERPDEERIRFRAYEISLQRGGQYGDPFEDWLRAERELTEQRSPQGEPPAA